MNKKSLGDALNRRKIKHSFKKPSNKSIQERIKQATEWFFGSSPNLDDVTEKKLSKIIIPSIIASDIIGVSPMTGPVGQIYSLRTKYNNILNANQDHESDDTETDEKTN